MLNCFPNHLEASTYALEQDAQGMIDSSDTSFDNLWASERALAEGCSKRAAKNVSTLAVPLSYVILTFDRALQSTCQQLQ